MLQPLDTTHRRVPALTARYALISATVTTIFTSLWVGTTAGHRSVCRCRGQRGQATTEYALVLLAAALVALMVVAWATAGGGGERVGRLFNRVIDSVIDRV